MKILGAVLTSEHFSELEDAVYSLKGTDEIIIFVDTWDKQHERRVLEAFSDEYKVVVSDYELKGSPGQGKNFVLDYFLQSDFTHMIPIDGDDFLWPGAIRKIKNLIQAHPADCYYYRGTDMINRERWITTKDWYKSYLDSRDGWQDERFDLLPTNFDVDRVAVETKKSAKIKYPENLYSFEDVYRAINLKMQSLKGLLKIYSVVSYDLYCYQKTTDLQIEKKRPRPATSVHGAKEGQYLFINRTNFPWNEKEHVGNVNTSVRFPEWSIEDKNMLKKYSLPQIYLEDELTLEFKKRYYNRRK